MQTIKNTLVIFATICLLGFPYIFLVISCSSSNEKEQPNGPVKCIIEDKFRTYSRTNGYPGHWAVLKKCDDTTEYFEIKLDISEYYSNEIGDTIIFNFGKFEQYENFTIVK